jgi:hypothetical protein
MPHICPSFSAADVVRLKRDSIAANGQSRAELRAGKAGKAAGGEPSKVQVNETMNSRAIKISLRSKSKSKPGDLLSVISFLT